MSAPGIQRLAPLLGSICLFACGSAPAPGPVPPALTPPPSTFRNGDVSLAYLLDLPAGSGPFPAVVLVHGSGPVTKEEQAWLSRPLVARGFAVLRFDKRGVGESDGAYSEVGVRNSAQQIPLLASDVVAAVEALAATPGIDPTRLGLLGGSQAGWIIPVAAMLSERVRFAVILVGPTVSVGLEIFFSDLTDGTNLPLAEAERQLADFSGAPGFEPRPFLDAMDIPSLWLYGLVDRSIPTRACLAVHEEIAIAHAFSVVVYPHLGHPLGPGIWADIGPWLDATVPR